MSRKSQISKDKLPTLYFAAAAAAAKSLQSCPTLCDSMDYSPLGISRQEYWCGLPRPPPGDLPNPGIEPVSLALADGFFTTSAFWELLCCYSICYMTGQ